MSLITNSNKLPVALKFKNIEHQIEKNVKNILLQSLEKQTSLVTELKKNGAIDEVSHKIYDDLLCFAHKDPSAKNSPEYILESYLSFQAVFFYRVANLLHCFSQRLQTTALVTYLKIVARKISETAKVKTGVEIHPGAKIGSRFIVDHGYGTVIGETTEIGDDCYILQGVVLGAKGIAMNHADKRHPTLGSRVEVGSFVRIFGPVIIGNDVKISPWAVITEDIPSNSKVVVLTTNQIVKTKNLQI